MNTPRALAAPLAACLVALLAATPATGQQQYPVVYAGTTGSEIYRIDMESGCIDWVKVLPTGEQVQCIAASRDGDLDRPAILAATNGNIFLLDGTGVLDSSYPYGVFGSGYYQTTPVAIDTDGEYAVAAHTDGKVRLYQIHPKSAGFSVVWTDDFDGRSVAIDGAGNRVVVTGPDGVAYYDHMRDGASGWSSADGVEIWSHALQGQSGPASGLTVAISPGGAIADRHVAVGTDDSRVFLFDRNGNQKWSFDSPRGKYMSVAIDYAGKLATCANDDPSNSKGAQLDGKPTSSGSSWTFVPDSPQGGDDCYALQAQHYSDPSGELNWFASGGSGSYGVFVHDTEGNLVWKGKPVRQRQRLSVFAGRPFGYTYVVTADVSKPEVHVYKTDQYSPRHVVTVSSKVRALSTAWAPETTGSGSCSIGASYCLAGFNSTGEETFLYAMGSPVAADDDLTLIATGCPPGAPGVFFYSLSGPVQPPPLFSTPAQLCVLPPVQRVPIPMVADPDGVMSLQLGGLNILPSAGSTAWYQLWYLDGPGPWGQLAHKTSNALEITFL